MQKTFSVVADFPEVLAKHHIQVVTVKAGSLELALKRGLAVIRKREGIKGRRISKVKVSAVLVAEQAAEMEGAA
jgi:hypothetical protein